MTVAQPIDWAAKYGALHAWAEGASGWTARWADQDAPRPDYPYVLLDIVSDVKEGGIDELSRTIDLTRARDIRITPTASNNQLYRVTINGEHHDYTSDADATVAEITAGLVAAIGLGSQPVTATDGTTYLDVQGDAEVANPGTARLFTVVLSGPMVWANNDAGNEVEIRITGSTAFTLNVQTFERNTLTDNPANDPSRNAYDMLTRLRASLGLPSVQTALRAQDIAVIEEGGITDLSEAEDDAFISRASMDVRMRTLSVLTEYTGYIATVSGATTFSGARQDPITDTLDVSS